MESLLFVTSTDRTEEVGWWRGSPEARSVRNGCKVALIVLCLTMIITQVFWPLDSLFMYKDIPDDSRTWPMWIFCLVLGTVVISSALFLSVAYLYLWCNWLRCELPLIVRLICARCGIFF